MREMKDSGVAWIGEIPKDWDLSRLKFSSTYNDESIKEDTNPEKEIEYVEIGSVTLENGVEKAEVMRFKDAPSRARRIARKGDIIISTVRTYLKAIALIEKESYTVSTGFCVIRPQKCMDSGYLKYFCSSELFTSEVSACSVGISYPAINASTLMDFHIINPPLAVQHKIVRVLDEKCNHVDSLIANVQAQIEKLKAYKQSLVTEVVTKGLDPNAPMKDSGVEWIGEIPAHWSILRFKNIADIKSNLVNPKDYMDYFQVSPENIEKGSGKLLTCITVREIGVESNNHLFHKGQIIYSKVRPLLNKVAIAPFDGLCSADMYPVEAKINKKFLVYSMLSDSFLNQVKLVTENRVKMPKINQEELSKIKVCCPEDSEQKRIADYLDAKCSQIDRLISLKESKIEKLQQYKRSLIYEYVTGKKEVV